MSIAVAERIDKVEYYFGEKMCKVMYRLYPPMKDNDDGEVHVVILIDGYQSHEVDGDFPQLRPVVFVFPVYNTAINPIDEFITNSAIEVFDCENLTESDHHDEVIKKLGYSL